MRRTQRRVFSAAFESGVSAIPWLTPQQSSPITAGYSLVKQYYVGGADSVKKSGVVKCKNRDEGGPIIDVHTR